MANDLINELRTQMAQYKTHTAKGYKKIVERLRKLEEISDSITEMEVELLWYLRNCGMGETFRFLRIARINYQAVQARRSLKKDNLI